MNRSVAESLVEAKVTLEFLSRQVDRVLDRIGAIADQIMVLMDRPKQRVRRLQEKEAPR